MTVAPPDPSTQPPVPRTFAPRPLDLRCAALAAAVGHDVRCQLQVGHDGEHALMFSDVGARRVLVWTADRVPQPITADWRSLAWLRGFPAPAWFEVDR